MSLPTARTMEAAEDRVLIERTAAGDARAFEAFVRRWEGPLYRFLRRATGSSTLAEEARQLTFVRIYTRAGTYAGGSIPVWLFRAAWRVAANLRRDEARAAGPRGSTETEIPDDAPEPGDALVGAEERAALRSSLDRLAPQDRAALWLRVGEGMSLARTARVLRIPPSTLRYRLYLSLRRLRRELGAPLGDGERHAMR